MIKKQCKPIQSLAFSQYPHFAIIRWRVETAGNLDVWVNGQLQGSTDLGSQPGMHAANIDLDKIFTLGSLADGASDRDEAFFSGAVGELLVYDELLTDADASALQDYLQSRWRPASARWGSLECTGGDVTGVVKVSPLAVPHVSDLLLWRS